MWTWLESVLVYIPILLYLNGYILNLNPCTITPILIPLLLPLLLLLLRSAQIHSLLSRSPRPVRRKPITISIHQKFTLALSGTWAWFTSLWSLFSHLIHFQPALSFESGIYHWQQQFRQKHDLFVVVWASSAERNWHHLLSFLSEILLSSCLTILSLQKPFPECFPVHSTITINLWLLKIIHFNIKYHFICLVSMTIPITNALKFC